MTLDGQTWTQLRTRRDFSPLDVCQRFTGSFATDGNTIIGTWESGHDGTSWRK
jgi:hypothetical protein